MYNCVCGSIFQEKNLSRHLKTQKHARFVLYGDNAEETQECSICTEETTKKSLCNHPLCANCYIGWENQCKRNRLPLTCPICRSRLHERKIVRRPRNVLIPFISQIRNVNVLSRRNIIFSAFRTASFVGMIYGANALLIPVVRRIMHRN